MMMIKSVDINEIIEKLELTIGTFQKLLDYQEKFLNNEIEEIDKKTKRDIKDKEIEEEVDIINFYHESRLNFLTGTFPDIQNKMAITIIYSLFENEMQSLCNLFAHTLSTPIKYNELSGQGMAKCVKFLNKFCGISDNLFKGENWEKIDCVRKIRNFIVHAKSDISPVLQKNKKQIQEFEKMSGFIVIDNHAVSLTNADFPKYYLKVIKDFHFELLNELKNNQLFELN